MLRLLGAALLLLLLVRPDLRGWRRPQWGTVLLFGATMAGMNGFFYASIDRIPLSVAVAIEFAGPLLLAAALSRRLIDGICVGAAAGSIVVLTLGGGHGDTASAPLDPLGVLFAIVAGAFWAAYIVAGRRVGTVVPGHGALAVGMLVSAVLLAPFGIAGLHDAVRSPMDLLPFALVALLSSFLPYSLEFAALRRLDARAFGVLLSLEPAAAALFGWVLLDQHLQPAQLAAVAVVIAASIVSTLSAPRASERAPGPPTAPVAAVR
ncbi:hypothetical protein GCM10025874_07110 [Arenivirga flava]|uniref:EamA domain-containing protein n=2 Tax=Arenivirga flava TaxID=1930060 RepID=A0AA37UE61_9MICO|nr:hypothetical protein GCM10025874_07110 [Arenivirga flava]